MLYEHIVKGECAPFLSLQARCLAHNAPCRFCASAQVLYTERPVMGALALEMSNSLTALEIEKKSLYRLQYNDLFRDKSILPLITLYQNLCPDFTVQ